MRRARRPRLQALDPTACDPASAAHYTGAQDARLPQACHDGPARSPGHGHRQGHNRYDRPRRAKAFRAFLNQIDAEVPSGLDVHIVLDNVSTHTTPEIKRWKLKHPRFDFHFTPTYSPWLNLVERWFAELTTKQIRRGTHTSVKELTESIQQWTDNWNENPRPFKWNKTAE